MSERYSDVQVHGHTITRLVTEDSRLAPLVIDTLRGAGVPLPNDNIRLADSMWYPLPVLLTLFHRIELERGRIALFEIGSNVPRSAEFPPSITDLQSALRSVNVAFHMNHRKDGKPLFVDGRALDGIGHYQYLCARAQKLIVCDCSNPYPCDFDFGLLQTMARRFEASAQVWHKPMICRRDGASSCSYAITWA